MESAKRISAMYSFWQLLISICIFIFPNLFNKSFVDFCRAVSVYIAITWCILYACGKYTRINLFYKQLFPWLDSNVLIFILDMATHILPAILLGWPQNNISFVFAAISIMSWYTIIHSSVRYIYNLTDIEIQQANKTIYVLLPVITFLTFILN